MIPLESRDRAVEDVTDSVVESEVVLAWVENRKGGIAGVVEGDGVDSVIGPKKGFSLAGGVSECASKAFSLLGGGGGGRIRFTGEGVADVEEGLDPRVFERFKTPS